ncbi:hypothetical protein QL285_089678 [Trifolium repens]|nr:hypothetical protein QL285_089678 [Trifolium repens]
MPSSFCSIVAVRARAAPVCRIALTLLSRQVIPLNFMGWIIGSSCYWAYAIRFWALVQSTAPQARGSKRRSGDSGRTWGNIRPLLRLSCIITSINNPICRFDFPSSLH